MTCGGTRSLMSTNNLLASVGWPHHLKAAPNERESTVTHAGRYLTVRTKKGNLKRFLTMVYFQFKKTQSHQSGTFSLIWLDTTT